MKPLQPLLNLAAAFVLGVGGAAGLLGRQAAGAPRAQASADCDTGRSVQVSGSATVNVTPDRALVKLGVETNGATPDGVRADNQAAVRRVTEAVRALGVADKDIATDDYLVSPLYSDNELLTIKGYRIDNIIAITLEDVKQAGPVLVAALKAGANEVLDVEFYTSQLRKYRDEARAMAMQAAAEKAQALASAGGTQAGCLLHVDENTWTYYSGGWWGGRAQAQWTQNVVQNAAGSSGAASQADDTPLRLGEIAVQAQVSAGYSLH
jgi:uncharacterized protein YggE